MKIILTKNLEKNVKYVKYVKNLILKINTKIPTSKFGCKFYQISIAI